MRFDFLCSENCFLFEKKKKITSFKASAGRNYFSPQLSGNFRLPSPKNECSLFTFFDFFKKNPNRFAYVDKASSRKEHGMGNISSSIKAPISAFPAIF